LTELKKKTKDLAKGVSRLRFQVNRAKDKNQSSG
jgi:hypothetical protein